MKQKKILYMIFIDLKKAYDKIMKNIMWRTLEKIRISLIYVTLIKDMYTNIVTSVREVFSPYIFILVMNEFTRTYKVIFF
jgi:hypothetical protein